MWIWYWSNLMKKRQPNRNVSILALLFLLSLNVSILRAQTAHSILVNSLDDSVMDDGSCTLREAVAAANTNTASGVNSGECAAGGSETVVDLTLLQGTVLLNSSLPSVTSSMTFQGPGPDQLMVRRNPSAAGFRIITVVDGMLTIDSLHITGGEAVTGGAILNQGGTVTIASSHLSGHVATSAGGAIYNDGGTLIISNSTIASNRADSAGGAIYNAGGVLSISASTAAANTSGSAGGGIYIHSGSVSFKNSTLSGNTAATVGGGLYNQNGAVTLNNVTVASNSANSGSGIGNEDGTLTLSNSLIANNTDADCAGTLTSTGHNLLQSPGAGCIISGDNAGNILNVNASIEALAANGGSTPTHALLADSPAIDAGNPATCEATDQRGEERPKRGACDIGAFEADFRYAIDPTLVSDDSSLPGIMGGPPRSIGAIVGPDGEQDEFVINEVIFHPQDDQELQTFLDKYNGVVLLDGTPLLLPEVAENNPPPAESSGWYLIRVDLQRSSLEDLPAHMEQGGTLGLHMFSSEDAARLSALLAREKLGEHPQIGPNILVRPTSIDEHPDGSGGFLDAESWWWLSHDDDPNMPGEQGLSTSVIRAWRYLNYKGFPPSNTTWSPPLIAIIDGGFDLDNSGNPLSAAGDFFPSKPWQLDLVDRDYTAGGMNQSPCGGGLSCPWHGQDVFGVAVARNSNQFGGAGTSGNFAWPLLVRVDGSFYTLIDAIRSSVINGADVINMSLGGNVRDDEISDLLESTVNFATSFNYTIVVASAGNQGMDTATANILPCETASVICVGSVSRSGNNVFNWGSSVDIWAPTNIYSTVTPPRANLSGIAAICRDPILNFCFGGTSASAPFVSGVIALMKVLDPSLTPAEVRSILIDTANPSNDSLVANGYIDALRAVQAVSPNQPPTAEITTPTDGSVVSYFRTVFIHADISDPEITGDFTGTVVFRSDKDGVLCRNTGFGGGGCTSPSPLSIGTHLITVTVTDRFDAVATDSITVQSVNSDPTVDITQPANNATFGEEQTITLRGTVRDSDETLLPDGSIVWRSNIDGILGNGQEISVSLSPGTHTITLTATDELGSTGQDTITLNIEEASGLPTALIVSPEHLEFVSAGVPATFVAQATDPQDGILSGSRVVWSSNIDGVLGTGNPLSVTLSGDACGPTRHTITLRVTDSDGNQASHSIDVYVGTVC